MAFRIVDTDRQGFMMTKLLAVLAATALTACSSRHSLRREPSSSDHQLPKQVVDQEQQDAVVIKQMPVDYRNCVLPVLVDLMREPATQKRNHLYVRIFGRDMDAYLQAALAKYGIAAYPVSALPKWGPDWGITPSERALHGVDPRFTPYWEFWIEHITARSPGRYSVGAGLYCGHLCYERLSYSLKVDGKLCIITSRRAIGES
jgi:hypothetical protein